MMGHLHVVFFYSSSVIHVSTPLNMRRQNIYTSERPSRKTERSNYTDQRKLRTGTRKRDVQLGFSFVLSGFGSVDFNECLQDLSEDYFGPIVCLLNWAVAHQSDSWLLRGSQVKAQRKRK